MEFPDDWDHRLWHPNTSKLFPEQPLVHGVVLLLQADETHVPQNGFLSFDLPQPAHDKYSMPNVNLAGQTLKCSSGNIPLGSQRPLERCVATFRGILSARETQAIPL